MLGLMMQTPLLLSEFAFETPPPKAKAAPPRPPVANAPAAGEQQAAPPRPPATSRQAAPLPPPIEVRPASGAIAKPRPKPPPPPFALTPQVAPARPSVQN